MSDGNYGCFVSIQFDDGFMDEHNMMLDDLQMDILEKHHHDNMQIMASMLSRVRIVNIYSHQVNINKSRTQIYQGLKQQYKSK